MKWGFFSVVHIATLVFAALLIGLLHVTLRHHSPKMQTAVLFLLSLSGVAALIWNLVKCGSPTGILTPALVCIIYLTIMYTPQFFQNEKTITIKAHKRKVRA